MKAGQTGYELKRLKRLSRQDLIKELAELKGLDDNENQEEAPPAEEEAAVVLRPKGRKPRRDTVAKVDSKDLGILTRGKVVVRGRPGSPLTYRRSK
ncbi:hypothetical protein ES708_20144 [subsurface metagenome]|jgi:hypothetical protein